MPETDRWRDRIVRTADDVDPASLAVNPDNWRIHPTYQKDALAAMIEAVGWIDRLIVSERSGRLVDGHARRELAIEHGWRVPVAYVDLAPEEEAAALVAVDLVRGAAGTDRTKAAELFDSLRGVSDRHQGALDLMRARLLPGSSAPARLPAPAGPATVNHVADAAEAEDLETLAREDGERGPTIKENYDMYLASDVRQVVLTFPPPEYAEVTVLLARARARYGVGTNADAVARLLAEPS